MSGVIGIRHWSESHLTAPFKIGLFSSNDSGGEGKHDLSIPRRFMLLRNSSVIKG